MIAAVFRQSLLSQVIVPILFIVCLLQAQVLFASVENRKPKIAIIIDDLGYRLKEGRRSLELSHPLTVAIIPSSPHATEFAESANCTADMEILVHMPMTPSREIAWEAGLNLQMNESEFSRAAERLLNKVPHAIGVNNHGGSKLTQNRERMDWLMTLLGQKKLFFVDSRTTSDSVAGEAAESAQIPFSVRDVFLDNNRDVSAINRQIDKLVELAIKHGHAVAIGHPYPETLAVLEVRLDELQAQGIELVEISKLLSQNSEIAVTQVPQRAPNSL